MKTLAKFLNSVEFLVHNYRCSITSNIVIYILQTMPNWLKIHLLRFFRYGSQVHDLHCFKEGSQPLSLGKMSHLNEIDRYIYLIQLVKCYLITVACRMKTEVCLHN